MDIDWGWIGEHTDTLTEHALIHLRLALLPVVFGLLISLPLGVLCRRWGWLYPPTLTISNVLYAIPSLALFMLFIDYTGLTAATVMIPLTLYSLSVLVPNVVDGLASVSEPVRQAATAMGFGPLRRLLRVELPIAVPIVIAGTRVAAVSSISLVAVGQLIGQGGLGADIIRGYQLQFQTQIVAATVLIILLALVTDAILVAVQRLLTPWARARKTS
ncbi:MULTISPECIES: ABC transporter permease [Actinomadura]|uniref:Osmoprotectant transport system permease protein n=1 Tax=Actinomadura madurae TaxID=1993 RepID=A0A1I5IT96_9ACTN|nr:ABC transporter permease [Actinomadura madurae]MCP9954223.1 ABC transporter permease [Actinomadura madurae]MCP9970981.1 ABC transporter permease [Actinomadura madurae]MCP9983458.1 ABC transporter permease [Actinomadura madurae]MCQ0004978.1 ABC transporter permease [Actinomadura madurae]MCQ0019698.1 ABC transporter permease [Actinomadura madurae]